MTPLPGLQANLSLASYHLQAHLLPVRGPWHLPARRRAPHPTPPSLHSPPLPFPPLPFVPSLPSRYLPPFTRLHPLRSIGPLNPALGSAVSVSSLSGVWDKAPADIEFDAF